MSLPKLAVVDGGVTQSGTPQWVDARTDSEVAQALYQRYRDTVFHLAIRYGGGDRTWAEDVTHDVFVQVMRHIGRLRSMDRVGGWLYRTTTNRCLTRLTRDRWRRFVPWGSEDPDVACPASPEELGIHREELRQLLEVVGQLPPKQQICFYMYWVDGKTQPEIAAQLGCTKSYVCKLLARVQRRLGRDRHGGGG